MRFLGVDLAWKADNPSGVVLLGGQGFPLHLRETPRTLVGHGEVLDWITRQVGHHRSTVGIDAPLLGTERPGRRPCDDAIARAFWSFDASTHSPPPAPDLRRFATELVHAYGLESFAPGFRPRSARPAIREVYPNALQVFLFGLRRGSKIRKYKKRRFGSNRRWVEAGLRPFVMDCAAAVAGVYVAPDDEWERFVSDIPQESMSTAELKAIEDRWDALLCALAVALEFLEHDVMTFYPPADWTAGAILAPMLREPSGVSTRAPAAREGRGSPGRAPDEAGADHQPQDREGPPPGDPPVTPPPGRSPHPVTRPKPEEVLAVMARGARPP